MPRNHLECGDVMATIRIVDLSARARLRKSHRDSQAAYREAIAKLSGDRVLELTPDAGESLRTLKLNVSRAATAVHRAVQYGVTPEGTLVVWPASIKRRPRRGPAE
jgi:hypothetical protein